jgi:hypothetical protein
MRPGYIIATIVFLSVCASAQTIDRSKLRDATLRNCPTESLKDRRLIDVLVIGGGNLANFCECLATRFAGQVDDADYGNENALNRKWADSRNLYLVTSIK